MKVKYNGSFFVSGCIAVCAALAIVCPRSSFYTFLLLFRYLQTKYFSSVALISLQSQCLDREVKVMPCF